LKIKLLNKKLPLPSFYVLSVKVYGRQNTGPPKMVPSESLDPVNYLDYEAKGK
jgi:hypothetical protein